MSKKLGNVLTKIRNNIVAQTEDSSLRSLTVVGHQLVGEDKDHRYTYDFEPSEWFSQYISNDPNDSLFKDGLFVQFIQDASTHYRASDRT